MIRFLFFALIGFAVYYVLNFLAKAIFFVKKPLDRNSEAEELVQDPCCQTYIPKRSAIRRRAAGKDFYFCNQECLKKFLEKERP